MSATGLIRVDVVPEDTAGLPVAVKDLAMLPAGGSVLVDVLGNDMDPAGAFWSSSQWMSPAGLPSRPPSLNATSSSSPTYAD
ncbi:hypothetical protein NHF46_04555 [Arthrobacter alpinus]|nr:hypothetical protein [Arthrobacter alpinus]